MHFLEIRVSNNDPKAVKYFKKCKQCTAFFFFFFEVEALLSVKNA